MNSRERVLTSINHEQPDKLAVDFGGMRSTGIAAIAYNNLKKKLGLPLETTKLYDIFQQLAEPEIDIIDRLGGDVVQIHRLYPAFGIAIDKWKPWTLPDGSPCLAPMEYHPIENEKGDYDIIDPDTGTIIARMPRGGLYFDLVNRYLSDIEYDSSALDRSMQIPVLTDEELNFIEAECIDARETGKATLFAFGGNIYEAGQSDFGFERFYLDLASEQEFLHHYFNKLTNAYIAQLDKLMERVGHYIDIIQFGDDLGTQNAPQISPAMYCEMIQPYHARIYGYIRKNYPDTKVFLHCCGSIYQLIPHLIDAGIEILNPVQITARGMDPHKLKKEFGRKLTFWGGGARMQTTAFSGTADDLYREARELIDIFSPGGGYVFNQVHNILASVPPEKVLAIYQAALDARRKSQ
mgnify:CR=1 FL=1